MSAYLTMSQEQRNGSTDTQGAETLPGNLDVGWAVNKPVINH